MTLEELFNKDNDEEHPLAAKFTNKIVEGLSKHHDVDTPVVVTYTDGETATMPTIREMVEQQQQLEDMFDQMMDMGMIQSMPDDPSILKEK